MGVPKKAKEKEREMSSIQKMNLLSARHRIIETKCCTCCEVTIHNAFEGNTYNVNHIEFFVSNRRS